ncbi:membrane protease YdiL (CAAX protease family) [Pseudomonas sp. TE3610]
MNLAHLGGSEWQNVRPPLTERGIEMDIPTPWLRPALLAALLFTWLWTAFTCVGPGYDWGVRIMAEAGASGWLASLAVIGGAGCDAVLGLGLLFKRWRRRVLMAQLVLMVAYTLFITLVLPHYWLDPYGGVSKNLVLIIATLWLYGQEARP